MNDEKDKTSHEESHANATVDEKQLFSTNGDERSKVHIAADNTDDNVITWEASEYIHHDKSMSWYLILTVATLLLAVVLLLATRDYWSIILLAVMYLAIVVYAKKEPRSLRYTVSDQGVSIGERHFDYGQFYSFSVSQETGVPSVTFTPTKRFMPPISIYFAPNDADKIVDQLIKFLPHEQKLPGVIDKAVLKLRF